MKRVLPVTASNQARTYHTQYVFTDNFFRFLSIENAIFSAATFQAVFDKIGFSSSDEYSLAMT